MPRIRTIFPLSVALLLAACSGADATFELTPNPDGRTYYCATCLSDVAWPEAGHRHGETAYCPDCEVRVPAEGHLHRENRWCDTCGTPAVWTDDVDRWASRGHYHGETAWCSVCRIDARIDGSAGESESGGRHHHNLTVYCPEEGCKVEVSRRMKPDGSGPADPAEVSPRHVHGKTVFCPVCKVEAERVAATDRPSKNHFHFITRYDQECGIESALTGHDHDVTRFCPICQTEIPIDPGVPTGSLRVGTSLTSDAGALGGDAFASINAELGEQQTVSAQIYETLKATEKKLDVPEMQMRHTHSESLLDYQADILPKDPVSRFRNFTEGSPIDTEEKENEELRAKFEGVLHPSRVVIVGRIIERLTEDPNPDEGAEEQIAMWREVIGKTIDRLEAIPDRTDPQETELLLWRNLKGKLGGAEVEEPEPEPEPEPKEG